MTEQEKKEMGNIEDIFNWTYPGATLYYRDCDLKSNILDRYKEGQIIRNGYFLDLSSMAAGLKVNTRFIVASAKAAKLYQVNPDVAKYAHCCINCNSFFKVLDILKSQEKTQIFLLHIPAKAIDYFTTVTSNIDKQFIERARSSFNEKVSKEPMPDLVDDNWTQRTNFPIGLDAQNNFYRLDSLTPIPKEGIPLYEGIRKLTNDNSDINTFISRN
jgi:hypothetical protein